MKREGGYQDKKVQVYSAAKNGLEIRFFRPKCFEFGAYGPKGLQGLGARVSHPGKFEFGNFENDVLQGIGKSARIKDEYIGQISNGTPHGVGSFRFKNGITEVGNFINYSKNGYCEILSPGKEIRGYFIDGAKQGPCMELFDNSVFTGVYDSQKRNGCGSIKSNSETIFIGHFSYNIPSNYCIMKFLNNTIYKGDLKDNKPNGIGRYKCSEFIYTGEFQMDLYSGIGILETKESRYLGEFKSGERDGLGYSKSMLASYIGYWKHDLQNGIGYLRSKTVQFQGQFKNGKFHGLGLINTGKQIYGRFKNGVLFEEIEEALFEEIYAQISKLDPDAFQEVIMKKINSFNNYIDQEEKSLINKVNNIHKTLAEGRAKLKEDIERVKTEYETNISSFKLYQEKISLIQIDPSILEEFGSLKGILGNLLSPATFNIEDYDVENSNVSITPPNKSKILKIGESKHDMQQQDIEVEHQDSQLTIIDEEEVAKLRKEVRELKRRLEVNRESINNLDTETESLNLKIEAKKKREEMLGKLSKEIEAEQSHLQQKQELLKNYRQKIAKGNLSNIVSKTSVLSKTSLITKLNEDLALERRTILSKRFALITAKKSLSTMISSLKAQSSELSIILMSKEEERKKSQLTISSATKILQQFKIEREKTEQERKIAERLRMLEEQVIEESNREGKSISELLKEALFEERRINSCIEDAIAIGHSFAILEAGSTDKKGKLWGLESNNLAIGDKGIIEVESGSVIVKGLFSNLRVTDDGRLIAISKDNNALNVFTEDGKLINSFPGKGIMRDGNQQLT